ncbi:MAG: hypothetical protein C4K47_10240 [Candidatus Thorarchaeota archaeon]|nr:MAG: hypothetical protein C4K47_10240 [Candidatus Thorarchaeota archaeon]
MTSVKISSQDRPEAKAGGTDAGGKEDFDLGRFFPDKYGLSREQRAYMMSQFGLVENHQATRELFPARPPCPATLLTADEWPPNCAITNSMNIA